MTMIAKEKAKKNMLVSQLTYISKDLIIYVYDFKV